MNKRVWSAQQKRSASTAGRINLGSLQVNQTNSRADPGESLAEPEDLMCRVQTPRADAIERFDPSGHGPIRPTLVGVRGCDPRKQQLRIAGTVEARVELKEETANGAL